MIPINEELIKRIANGDLIVQGEPGEILKSNYEDGWYVVGNLRVSEELEVEKSGIHPSLSSSLHIKRKLPYREFIGNNWYILEGGEVR